MPSQKKKTPTEFLKLKHKNAQCTKLSEMQIPAESEEIYLGFT